MADAHVVPVVCSCDQTPQAQQIGISTATSFAQVLASLTQSFGTPISSFEYYDEDNTPYAVTNDAQLQSMWHQYHYMLQNGLLAGPLRMTAFSSGTAASRNLEGLRIDVGMDAEPDFDYGGIHMGVNESPLLSAAADEAPLQVRGDQMADFTFLGKGTAGSVYRAVHAPTNIPMAVKIIQVEATFQVQEAITTELSLLHQCTSEHIIRYYGVYFDETSIHICTEFMDGFSLDKYGQMPERVLGPVTVGILRGLHYLSTLKIIHRDVKPSNFLVNTQGDVKLCDFGVSRQLEKSYAKTFVGTGAYMAPERILGQPYDARSEIWSVGIALVELATGRYPYRAPGAARALQPIELVRCIVNEPVPSLPAEEFSPQFLDFVQQCLTKDPSQRPTATALLQSPLVMMYSSRGREELAKFVRERVGHH